VAVPDKLGSDLINCQVLLSQIAYQREYKCSAMVAHPSSSTFICLGPICVSDESSFPFTSVRKPSCECEISSSHGGKYEVQNCLLGYTAV
jgi:hypothetical protein